MIAGMYCARRYGMVRGRDWERAHANVHGTTPAMQHGTEAVREGATWLGCCVRYASRSKDVKEFGVAESVERPPMPWYLDSTPGCLMHAVAGEVP
jgi:hypothetical protein